MKWYYRSLTVAALGHLGVRMAKYAPIKAAQVAQALLAGAQLCAQDNKSRILEGRELFAMAN